VDGGLDATGGLAVETVVPFATGAAGPGVRGLAAAAESLGAEDADPTGDEVASTGTRLGDERGCEGSGSAPAASFGSAERGGGRSCGRGGSALGTLSSGRESGTATARSAGAAGGRRIRSATTRPPSRTTAPSETQTTERGIGMRTSR